MKKTFLLIVLLVASVALHAQKEVTKFLGIPVDGTKAAMIQKLKEKGFTSDPYVKDVLKGTFNGDKVNLVIGTNNGKVCRIAVVDANASNETNIRIKFNTLCQQFRNNKKYISASTDDYTLPDDENISYNMTVNNKRYQAAYYQLPNGVDKTNLTEKVLSSFADKYTQEQMSALTDEQRNELIEQVTAETFGQWEKCSVWFMIDESYGKYYIKIFYDNEYNQANGEDL